MNKLLCGTLILLIAISWKYGGVEASSKKLKCPIGRYYNDGCTECNCDPGTGSMICDKSRCPEHPRVCPHGEIFKDRNGNQCKCYADTGAVFCAIVAFRKKEINPSTMQLARRAHPGLQVEGETLIDIAALDDSAELNDQIADESIPKVSLLSDTENAAGGVFASSEESETVRPMKMLEYSGRRWKMRPERVSFSNYKTQIEQVLASYREKRKAEGVKTLFIELPQL